MSWSDAGAVRAATLPPGTVVAGFVVEALHAEGGSASVYRARRGERGEHVALKVLRSEFLGAAETLARFEREAETIAGLDHPHIVKVLAHGELATRQPWLAMEWLDGESVDRWLAARGPLTALEALSVLEQVGGALAAAHARGVVHRDVKAQNVIVEERGGALIVKVVDFGIARLTAPELRMTMTGDVLGTPAVMAPEQIRGEVADARTDIYGVGCLLYQLLTTRLPFEGAARHELEDQHLHAPPPRVSAHATVPVALDLVITHALAKDRAARPASMAVFLDELRRALGRAPAAGSDDIWFAARVALRLGGSGDGEDDAVWDEVDALLLAAREALAGVAMTVEHVDLGGLLAVARLPADPAAAAARQDELVAAAEALARRLAARASAAVTTVDTRVGARSDLLRLSAWS